MKELDRLGNFTSSRSDWATGVVVVLNMNGAIRLCGNYKLKTVSLPNIHIEEILADLSGGAKFSTFDFANTYIQMDVCEASTECVTMLTHTTDCSNSAGYGITTAHLCGNMQ